MKNKILETELTSAAEHLALTLRNYSASPMSCNITIDTSPGKGKTDYYSVETCFYYTDELVINIGARIYYDTDEHGIERIKKVDTFFREVKNDTPGETREELPPSR